MTSRPIVVVGSVNMDLVLRCPRLPLPGQTVAGGDLATLPGGKGANQAVAAARLGAPVCFIGCVGEDAFGDHARDALQREGIDISRLATVAVPTGIAIVLVDEASGQNSIAISAGANAALTTERIAASADVIGAAALLVCQLESPLPAVFRAIEIAHAKGVPVLLNPAPAVPLPPALLAQVDLLVPNESEAAQLSGGAPTGPFDAAGAARALRGLGANTVIVTLGADGVFVDDGAAPRHHAAPVTRAVDTTGAGDTFIGAFAVAYREGATLDEAVTFAQRAAAISVTRPGAMAAMPRREELKVS